VLAPIAASFAWGVPACIGKQQACAEPFLQAVKGRSLGIIDVDPGVPPRQLTNVAHDQAQPESSSAPITAVNGCHLLGEEPCRKLYGPPQSPWWPQTGGYPLRKAEFLLRRKATLEFVQNYFGRFFHEGCCVAKCWVYRTGGTCLKVRARRKILKIAATEDVFPIVQCIAESFSKELFEEQARRELQIRGLMQ